MTLASNYAFERYKSQAELAVALPWLPSLIDSMIPMELCLAYLYPHTSHIGGRNAAEISQGLRTVQDVYSALLELKYSKTYYDNGFASFFPGRK